MRVYQAANSADSLPMAHSRATEGPTAARRPYMGKAAIGTDGRTFVSSEMEWIYVWDIGSGALHRKFPSPNRCDCTLALAPDGRTLAASDTLHAAHDDDTIRLFDIENGEQILALEHGDGRAHVLSFRPIATASSPASDSAPPSSRDLERH